MCLSRFSKWIFLKLNGTAPAFRAEWARCFSSPCTQVTKPARADWSEQSLTFCVLAGLLFFNLFQHFCKKKLQHQFSLTTKSICVRVNNTRCATVTPPVTNLFFFYASWCHLYMVFLFGLLRDACQMNLFDNKHSSSGDKHVSWRRGTSVKTLMPT